jgi:hypothetical protein
VVRIPAAWLEQIRITVVVRWGDYAATEIEGADGFIEAIFG